MSVMYGLSDQRFSNLYRCLYAQQITASRSRRRISTWSGRLPIAIRGIYKIQNLEFSCGILVRNCTYTHSLYFQSSQVLVLTAQYLVSYRDPRLYVYVYTVSDIASPLCGHTCGHMNFETKLVFRFQPTFIPVLGYTNNLNHLPKSPSSQSNSSQATLI